MPLNSVQSIAYKTRLIEGHRLYSAKEYDKAELKLKVAIEIAPNDFYPHQILTRALYRQGKHEEAKHYGLKTLELKKQYALKKIKTRKDPDQLKLRAFPSQFDPAAKSRNIISFVLWGDQDKYCLRAIKNAEIAPFIYPEWTCRFYCDETVPQDVISKLKRLRAQLRFVSGEMRGYDRLFWRFFPSDDASVDRFLSRDCDSLLNCQERVAVDDWIASGKPFHIMRDHINHMDLMLAGMWGGISGFLPPLTTLLTSEYLGSGFRGTDQDFLRDVVWPLIKDDVLSHDSYYHPHFGIEFPPYGRLVRPAHVGGS